MLSRPPTGRRPLHPEHAADPRELGTDPAADRLLVNLLRYAARDQQQPLADLPADFDAQLQAMGYP